MQTDPCIVFTQFCVHVQQPPISNQSVNTVPLTPEKLGLQSGGGRTVCESALELWHVSAISSKVVCAIFWWAAKAGLLRDVPCLALRPGGGIGNHKGHLDMCLGRAIRRQPHYLFPVPGHKRPRSPPAPCTMCQRYPCMKVLAKELRDAAEVPSKLEEARENGTLPHSYWDHPVVKASSTPVLTGAVFMDGVAYSHTGSVLDVWAINMISEKRHVVCPDSQEADVQVRMPGMVFPVTSDDPASFENVRCFCPRSCAMQACMILIHTHNVPHQHGCHLMWLTTFQATFQRVHSQARFTFSRTTEQSFVRSEKVASHHLRRVSRPLCIERPCGRAADQGANLSVLQKCDCWLRRNICGCETKHPVEQSKYVTSG